MKRIFALLLALTMLLAMGACGGAGGNSSNAPAEAPANAPADADSGDAAFEEITLRVSIQSNENETQAKIWKIFQQYVEEQTGGSVKFDVYYGGQLASSPEELEMIKAGTVDFIIPMHVMFPSDLLFLNMPGFIKGSCDEVLAFANYIYFEDPVTSALVEQEAKDNNVVYLNVNFSGSCAFCGNRDFSTLAEVQGQKLGNIQTAQFEAAGINVVTVEPPDMYEALSRGTVDFSQMAIDGIYALRWYEACKAVVLDGLTAYGNIFTMRRDLFESCSPALQQVFIDAGNKAHEE